MFRFSRFPSKSVGIPIRISLGSFAMSGSSLELSEDSIVRSSISGIRGLLGSGNGESAVDVGCSE